MKVFLNGDPHWGALLLAGRQAREWMSDALLPWQDDIVLSDFEMADPDQDVLFIRGIFPLLTKAVLDDLIAAAEPTGQAFFATLTHANRGLYYWRAGAKPAELSAFSDSCGENVCEESLYLLECGMSFANISSILYEQTALRAMAAGVLLHAPDKTWIDASVEFEAGCVIAPNVQLSGATRIGAGCQIGMGAVIRNSSLDQGVEVKPYSVIDDSRIGARAQIGPFAHIRMGCEFASDTRIGNFVETKKVQMGEGSKASHLAYLGDALIGSDCNIGAGTITCNYDGFQKHKTRLGDRVFIGSDSQLVAPVQLGDDAFVAAGSTITRDVAAGALAISRTRQENMEGRALKLRERAAAKAGKSRA